MSLKSGLKRMRENQTARASVPATIPLVVDWCDGTGEHVYATSAEYALDLERRRYAPATVVAHLSRALLAVQASMGGAEYARWSMSEGAQYRAQLAHWQRLAYAGAIARRATALDRHEYIMRPMGGHKAGRMFEYLPTNSPTCRSSCGGDHRVSVAKPHVVQDATARKGALLDSARNSGLLGSGSTKRTRRGKRRRARLSPINEMLSRMAYKLQATTNAIKEVKAHL